MKPAERGFTLIELLVATAIVALLATAAGMSVFQVVKGTERSNDHTTAVRHVQNAGYWVSRDALVAQSIDVGETPEDDFITLNWTAWESGEVHKIVYTLHDMAGGLKKLKRTYWIDGEGGEPTLVAEYIIDSASFEEQDGVWELAIQARSGTQTETREYKVKPRVNM